MNAPILIPYFRILYVEYTRSLFMAFQWEILCPYFFNYQRGTLHVHSVQSPGKMGCKEETAKMAHLLDLPLELLNTIITLLAMSSSGARDWVMVSSTCTIINTVATQTNVLRVVNCLSVMLAGRCEPHHHINGLLSRCVRAGNLSAQYMLAKALLRGGTPLWKMILENDLTNSSIKCATTLPLSERRYIALSLNTNSIADLPYVSFFLEDLPQTREAYGRLHHLRLIRSFIVHAVARDFIPLRHVLKDFMEFFVGYHKYSESHIHDTIGKMWWYECLTRTDRPLSGIILETFFYLRLPVGFPSYREQVIMAFDNLLQQEGFLY